MVVVGDAQQYLAAVEPVGRDRRRAVGGHPVVELPLRADDAASVHRAEHQPVVECVEHGKVFGSVGARQHTVDLWIGEGCEQCLEESAAVGHRKRIAWYAERAACRVIGSDDEQAAVAQERAASPRHELLEWMSRLLGTGGDEPRPAVVIQVRH